MPEKPAAPSTEPAYEVCAQDEHVYSWITTAVPPKDGTLVATCIRCGAELVALARAESGRGREPS